MVKLLLVDDEKGITDTLQGFFQYRGFTVDTANSGEEALEMVKNDKPQIVFLDIKMPGISGLEALERIKKIDENIRVIMLSTTTDKKIVDKAFEYGADEYITKPFRLEQLDSILIKNLQQF